MKELGRLTLVASACAVLALDACTGSTYGVNPFPKPTPTSGSGAFVRFINAAPDAGSVNVSISASGVPLWSSVPYVGTAKGFGHGGTDGACGSGICAYQAVAPGALDVAVAGASAPLISNKGGVVVGAGQRVTIVLVGEVSKGNLAILAFGEPLYVASASASASFHDASPASVSQQPWTPGAFPVANPGAGVAFMPVLVYPPTGVTAVSGITTPVPSQGIGFFVAPVQGGTSTIVFTPNLIDPSNTGNVMPFAAANSLQNGEQNLSMYLIDGASPNFAPAVVGVFDPNG